MSHLTSSRCIVLNSMVTLCCFPLQEFLLCRDELGDPRRCLPEGRDVTACSFEFFRLIKKHCHQEFTQYANCLDKSSSDLHFRHCRNTQGVYDKCVLDNLKLERPGYGYFCRAQVHDSPRPKPQERQRPTYDDVPNFLPDDEPRTKAPYESRFFI